MFSNCNITLTNMTINYSFIHSFIHNNNDPQIDFSLTRKKDEFKSKLKLDLISLLSDDIICNRYNSPVCN